MFKILSPLPLYTVFVVKPWLLWISGPRQLAERLGQREPTEGTPAQAAA
jgi:hypothetical protein